MKTIQIVVVGQQNEDVINYLSNIKDVTIVVKQQAEEVIEYAHVNLIDIVLTDKNDHDGEMKLQKILSILQQDVLVMKAENIEPIQKSIAQKRAMLQAAQQITYSVADDALKQAMLPIQIL